MNSRDDGGTVVEAMAAPAMMFSMMTFFFAVLILNKLGAIEKQLARLVKLPDLSDAVKLLAADPRQKILAIKAYREETGLGLAEAKAAVEAYIRSQKSGARDA